MLSLIDHQNPNGHSILLFLLEVNLKNHNEKQL